MQIVVGHWNHVLYYILHFLCHVDFPKFLAFYQVDKPSSQKVKSLRPGMVVHAYNHSYLGDR
jgi:hypothetical protein